MKHQPGFEDSEVAFVFEAYPKEVQLKLLAIRQLIFDTAAETDGVGSLEETLKWGQPSYLTSESKSNMERISKHVSRFQSALGKKYSSCGS